MKKKLLKTIAIAASIIISVNINAQTKIDWAMKGSKIVSVHSDKNGNTYMAGNFVNTLDLDYTTAGTYTAYAGSSSNQSSFISKYSPQGNFLWAYVLKTDSYGGPCEITDMKIDSLNNIVIAGRSYGSVDFDIASGNTYTISFGSFNKWDLFLAKFDTDCELKWAGKINGYNTSSFNNLAIDNQQNIYLNGSCNNCKINLFSPQTNSLTAQGMFISKYDPNGNFLFGHQYKNTGGGGNVFLDINKSTDEVILSAQFSNQSDIDPSPTASVAISGMSTVRYAPDMTLKNHFPLPVGVNSYKAIKVSNKGDVFLAADIRYACDLDPGPGTYTVVSAFSSSYDFAIAKYDSLGNFKKAALFGDTNDDYVNSMNINDSNFIYITGSYMTGTDFDPSPSNTVSFYNSSASTYLAKYNDTLGYVFAFPIKANSYNSIGYTLVPEKNGDMYLTCNIGNSTFDFDPSPATYNVTGSSGGVYVIAKYNHTGPIPTSLPNEIIDLNQTIIYPNPANDQVTIANLTDATTIHVIDITGRTVYSEKTTASQVTINTSNLANGIYSVQLINNQGVSTKKLMVSK